MRLDLAQYQELAAFAQFGTDLDKATQERISRGERMMELLKQAQYQPMPVEEQIAVIYAGVNKYLDDLPVEKVRLFEQEYLQFLRSNYAFLLMTLGKRKRWMRKWKRTCKRAWRNLKKTSLRLMRLSLKAVPVRARHITLAGEPARLAESKGGGILVRY